MACRGACCCSSAGRLNADNARFLLLAVLIVLYMLCGAAVFSAIELPTEREAKERWEERLENFTRRHNLSRAELRHFLREYEEASVAGIRVDDIRPRWDFTGAFYFVGTVVSTIDAISNLHCWRFHSFNKESSLVHYYPVVFLMSALLQLSDLPSFVLRE
ncbi:hypothetical protein DUI87_25044 [Hirundo rustica rustica]|uniref:Potassium channel domain-containing protein n=1 Tax=Hirundo rustica rustica TaxID=333673 RepID=A0A3M0JCX7_HIRRU|nr:hypothetical protein DUI87_25044 [Hirundo rustica rustica]